MVQQIESVPSSAPGEARPRAERATRQEVIEAYRASAALVESAFDTLTPDQRREYQKMRSEEAQTLGGNRGFHWRILERTRGPNGEPVKIYESIPVNLLISFLSAGVKSGNLSEENVARWSKYRNILEDNNKPYKLSILPLNETTRDSAHTELLEEIYAGLRNDRDTEAESWEKWNQAEKEFTDRRILVLPSNGRRGNGNGEGATAQPFTAPRPPAAPELPIGVPTIESIAAGGLPTESPAEPKAATAPAAPPSAPSGSEVTVAESAPEQVATEKPKAEWISVGMKLTKDGKVYYVKDKSDRSATYGSAVMNDMGPEWVVDLIELDNGKKISGSRYSEYELLNLLNDPESGWTGDSIAGERFTHSETGKTYRVATTYYEDGPKVKFYGDNPLKAEYTEDRELFEEAIRNGVFKKVSEIPHDSTAPAAPTETPPAGEPTAPEPVSEEPIEITDFRIGMNFIDSSTGDLVYVSQINEKSHIPELADLTENEVVITNPRTGEKKTIPTAKLLEQIRIGEDYKPDPIEGRKYTDKRTGKTYTVRTDFKDGRQRADLVDESGNTVGTGKRSAFDEALSRGDYVKVVSETIPPPSGSPVVSLTGPETIPAAAPAASEQVSAPEGPKKVKSFKTSQGSIYIYDNEGKTTRLKYGRDLRPRKDLTVFVDLTSQEKDELLDTLHFSKDEKVEILEKRPDGTFVARRDIAQVENPDEIYVGIMKDSQATFNKKASIQPHIGASVFEVGRGTEQDGKEIIRRHLGHEVTEIEYESEAAVAPMPQGSYTPYPKGANAPISRVASELGPFGQWPRAEQETLPSPGPAAPPAQPTPPAQPATQPSGTKREVVFASQKEEMEKLLETQASELIAQEISRGSLRNPFNWARKLGLSLIEPYAKQRIVNEIKRKAIEAGNPYAEIAVAQSQLKFRDFFKPRRSATPLVTTDTETTRERGTAASLAAIKEVQTETGYGQKLAEAQGPLRQFLLSDIITPIINGDFPDSATALRTVQDRLRAFIKNNQDDQQVKEFFGAENNRYGRFADYFATNLMELAAEIRAEKQGHRVGIDEIDQEINIKLAKIKSGPQTEAVLNNANKAVEWIESHRASGLLINTTTVSLAASLATAFLLRPASSTAAKVVLTPVAGALVGAAFSAHDRSYKVRLDRATRMTQRAMGKTADSEPRRAALKEFDYETVSATDLKDRITGLLGEDLADPNNQEALARVRAEIRSLIDFSVEQKIDKINYDSAADASIQRSQLVTLRAESATKLREAGWSDERISEADENLQGTFKKQYLENEEQQDKAFNIYRVRQMRRAAAEGAVIGGTIGAAVSIAFHIAQPNLEPALETARRFGHTLFGGFSAPSGTASLRGVASGSRQAVETGVQGSDALILSRNTEMVPDKTLGRKVMIPEGTEWFKHGKKWNLVSSEDRSQVLLRDAHWGEKGKLLYDQQSPLAGGVEQEWTRRERPIHGKNGLWREASIPIDSNKTVWTKEGIRGIMGTAKDGNAVILFLPHQAEGVFVTLGGHSDRPIWIPAEDHGHDGRPRVRLDPDSRRMIRTPDGKRFRLGDIAKAVLNEKALSKLPDGGIATEMLDRRDVFSICDKGKNGTLEAGKMVRTENGEWAKRVFSTIQGSTPVPEKIGESTLSVVINPTDISGEVSGGSGTDIPGGNGETNGVEPGGGGEQPGGKPFGVEDIPLIVPIPYTPRKPLEPFGPPQTRPQAEPGLYRRTANRITNATSRLRPTRQVETRGTEPMRPAAPDLTPIYLALPFSDEEKRLLENRVNLEPNVVTANNRGLEIEDQKEIALRRIVERLAAQAEIDSRVQALLNGDPRDLNDKRREVFASLLKTGVSSQGTQPTTPTSTTPPPTGTNSDQRRSEDEKKDRWDEEFRQAIQESDERNSATPAPQPESTPAPEPIRTTIGPGTPVYGTNGSEYQIVDEESIAGVRLFTIQPINGNPNIRFSVSEKQLLNPTEFSRFRLSQNGNQPLNPIPFQTTPAEAPQEDPLVIERIINTSPEVTAVINAGGGQVELEDARARARARIRNSATAASSAPAEKLEAEPREISPEPESSALETETAVPTPAPLAEEQVVAPEAPEVVSPTVAAETIQASSPLAQTTGKPSTIQKTVGVALAGASRAQRRINQFADREDHRLVRNVAAVPLVAGARSFQEVAKMTGRFADARSKAKKKKQDDTDIT